MKLRMLAGVLAGAVTEGRIYVAGGYRADRSTAATVEVYDPATNAWSFAAPMPEAGGRPPDTLAVLEAFDAATSAWSALAGGATAVHGAYTPPPTKSCD
jgi:hypothetical protein